MQVNLFALGLDGGFFSEDCLQETVVRLASEPDVVITA